MAGGCRQWYSGFDVQCIEYLASTEIYHGGHWIIVEPLPVAVLGVRGASLDNTVYMTGSIVYIWVIITELFYTVYFLEGGQDREMNHRPEIWRYSAESGSWSPVIYMRTERSYHAVSVVNCHDYCG